MTATHVLVTEEMAEAGRLAYKDRVNGQRGLSRADVTAIVSAALSAMSPSPRGKALEEALRPFAEAAARIRADDPDNDRPCLATVANYRAARALLESPG